MNRVLHNKIPNTSGNGFKLKRDIPDQYSDIFHVEVPEDEVEDDDDIGEGGEGTYDCKFCDKKLLKLEKHLKRCGLQTTKTLVEAEPKISEQEKPEQHCCAVCNLTFQTATALLA